MTRADILTFQHPGGIIVWPAGKWIWLRVARTASSAIMRAGLPDVHYLVDDGSYDRQGYLDWLAHVTDEELAGYFVWTIVRNPYDRFVSALSYLHVDIDEFCGDPVASLTPTLRLHLMPQYHYARRASFVGRYETLDADYRRVCERIGVPAITLPRVNGSLREGVPYRELITADHRRVIDPMLARSCAELGYEF